jgi:hypothetical protein
MLISLFALYLLTSPTVDAFKREMGPLQTSVDTTVASTGAQITRTAQATYIEGYGVVVMLEVAFEAPPGIFTTPKPAAELRKLVEQRRADLQEKLKLFVTQRVGTADSLDGSESLSVVVNVLNTTPAAVPKLPVQIQVTAKKGSQQPASYREF